MLRRSAFFALTFFVSAIARPAAAQDLDQILEQHFEAMGGVEAWKSLETMHATGTMVIGGGLAEGPFEVSQKRPAMYRLDLSMAGADIVSAYDGATAWEINPSTGSFEAQEADPEIAEGIMENADLDGPLIGWREDGHTVEFVGSEMVEGQDTHKLLVTTNGTTNYYFVDAESYLLVRVENGPGNPISVTRMSDYREISGLMFPFSISIDGGQVPLELVFDEIEVNIEVDEAQFLMGNPRAGSEGGP